MSFEQLYYDVIKLLPFSITGYHNREERLYNFYDKLAECLFMKQNSHIKFFFCAFPLLKDYHTWELEKVDIFYFKTYTYSNKEAILSFYFYLLSKHCKGKTNAEILANLFAKDIDVKVTLCSYDVPIVEFDGHNSILQIQIPKKIFATEVLELNWNVKFEEMFRNNKDFEVKNHNSELYKTGHYYKISSNSINSTLFDKIVLFDIQNFEIIQNYLIKLINERYKYFLINYDDDVQEEWIRKFVGGVLSATFLCRYYNCEFEYMLGTAKVEFETSKNKGNISKREIYRNLGGIVVGYRSGSDFSPLYRSFFNIVVDRITSVLAGYVLYKENKKYKAESNRKKMKSALTNFGDSLSPNQLHGQSPIDIEMVKVIETVIDENYWFAGDIFKNKLRDLILNNNQHITYHLLTKFDFSSKDTNVKDVSCYEHFFELSNGVKKAKFSINKRINLPYVYSFFERLLEEREDFEDGLLKETYPFNSYISCENENNSISIILKVSYKPFFNYSQFISKLQDKYHTGSFLGLITKHYDLLLAHGNFQMHTQNNGSEICLFDAFEFIEIDKNGEIIIDNDKIPIGISEIQSEITVKFIIY